MEGDNRTPKANLRQERIVNTRPGLVVIADNQSLTTINEESQMGESAINFSQANTNSYGGMVRLFGIGKSQVSNFSSSELKSQKTNNTLEQVPMDDQANSGKNAPSVEALDFRFDMIEPGFTKLRSCQNPSNTSGVMSSSDETSNMTSNSL